MKQPHPDLTLAALPLDQFNIPHWDVVLDEIFLLPAEAFAASSLPKPQNVGELAKQSGLSIQKTHHYLKKISQMSEAIEITCGELQQILKEGRLFLLDVREPFEFKLARLEGSVLLADHDFSELLPTLQAADRVVTICHHGIRSYSAAMALRDQGIQQAVSLRGGLDEWARTIDPLVARY